MAFKHPPRPGSGIRTDLPDYEAVSFDIEAFDQLLIVHGVEMVHYRAMRCPVGMVDRFDNRRPHEDHESCSNGFIYKQAGSITVVLTANSKSQNLLDVGLVDFSTVSATLPAIYDDTEEHCHIAPFDRLYLKEESTTVIHWQLFEANQTGFERLHYPVAEVEHLIDSKGHEYGPNDYDINNNGQIVWKTGALRPSYDPSTGKGDVCSIRYRYRPYWYVERILRETRIARAEDPATGERIAYRMPYEATLQRERFFESEDKDEKAALPNSLRQVVGQQSGGFGPR